MIECANHQDLNRQTVNTAVLTMMYHVAGDCKRQDTLMQLPILKVFYEIWVDNAIKEDEEFKDLIEFVLEVFMSNAETDPSSCVLNLLAGGNNGGGSPQASHGGGGSSAEMESAMNMSSSCGADFSDEEQELIFAWMAELDGSNSNVVNAITARLQEHGFVRTREEVTKYLTVNGYQDDLTKVSSTTSSPPPHKSANCEQENVERSESNVQKESHLMSQLSTLQEEDIIPFLLDKLREQGLESQLVWFQRQLLETAYVKITLSDPQRRTHVEEPVPKFFALQNKPVPVVPWNEELESAMLEPAFRLLQQGLGLFTPDDNNFLFTRIPPYMTPAMLVSKAQLIGPIENLGLKFEVDTLKHTDLGQDGLMTSNVGQTHSGITSSNRSVKTLDHQWLNYVMKMNKAGGN